MKVSILLADRPIPPFRLLWEGDLPAVPDAGEPFAFDNRQYKVLERSWRFGLAEVTKDTVLGPMSSRELDVGVGLLVQQIGGVPHVTMDSAG